MMMLLLHSLNNFMLHGKHVRQVLLHRVVDSRLAAVLPRLLRVENLCVCAEVEVRTDCRYCACYLHLGRFFGCSIDS